MSVLLPPENELTVVGIADAGSLETERVLLRPLQPTNLGEFILTVGRRARETVVPVPDLMFWFGPTNVVPPAEIVVYTRPGATNRRVSPDGTTIFEFYWGRQTPAF